MFNNEGLIDLEKKSNKMIFEKTKRQIELKLLSPEKGTNQEAIDIAANYILSFNTIKCIRKDDEDEFWIYRDGIYLPEGKTYIIEICDNLFHVAYTSQKANQVCSKIKVKTFIESKDFFNQQINYYDIIAVNNGLLDLKNKELLPFSDKYYFFNKLPMNYNSNSNCENFELFLKQILKKEDDFLVVQELFGFSLLKDYTFEKAFMFYGEHGRNGKSKLLEILKHFIGDENVSSLSLQDIEKKPFSLCYLQNKLVNIGSDISNEALNFTGNFKKLTGRDTLSADRKNKSYIDFVNYAKMIFTANELPPISTLSDAFWLRWVIIEFPYQFLPKKEIDALPINNREGVFLQDPTIVQKLTSVSEMEGILNWAIVGLHRLWKNKDFSNKETAKDNHLIWLRRSNSCSAFIYDDIEVDFDSMISKNEFKKRYLAYCKSNKLKTVNDRVIKRTVEDETGAVTHRKEEKIEGFFGNVKISYWEGIRFKTKTIELKEEQSIINTDSVVNVSEEFVSDDISDDIIDKLKQNGDLVEISPGTYRRLE